MIKSKSFPKALQPRICLPAVTLLLASALLAAAQTPAASPAQPTNPPPTVAAADSFSFGNVFSRYLKPYEPIYFLLGTQPAAEFQFSLKFQVSALTNGNMWARTTTNIYLAYTQTSFWDLLTSDPSFYDTSYKPSAFYRMPNLTGAAIDNPVHLGFQAGAEHESNGRGGTGERSMYRVYLQPTLTLGHLDTFYFSLTPRAWMYVINLSQNNPDMAAYKGYASLQSTVSWKKAAWDPSQFYKLTTTYGLGDDGGYASWKFDLSCSLTPWAKWFTPRIHVQYFTGYGQTLRQYNQYSHGLRAGISLYD